MTALTSRGDFRLEFRRLEEDRMLLQMYVLRIPVVMVGGREVFEARDMDLEGRWKRKLEEMLSVS